MSESRAEIVTKLATIEGFCQKFVAKHKSLALKTQRRRLMGSDAIVMGDFAKNYSFMV